MRPKKGGRKPTGKAPGRPTKELDWKKVDELMICGAHGTEIASAFDMHPETFYIKVEEKYKMGFTEYSRQKKEHGDALIRAKQFSKAVGLSVSGDNTLLIWLGKTRLKQRETDDKEVCLNDKTIEDTLEKAKLKAEIAELRKIVNESKAGTEHLPSEQASEYMVRSSSVGEDIQ